MRLITIIIILSLFSCTESYKKNAQVIPFNCSKEIATGTEYGIDSNVSFFPKIIFNENAESSYYPKVFSYALFKMKEPILSECYLNREIYRLIIKRAFHPFTTIEINKSKDSIWIDTKILDRVILGPFMPEAEYLVLDSAEHKKYLLQHPKEISRMDSFNKVIRNTNYFVATNIHKIITDCSWSRFSDLLLKTNFWQRQSYFCNECVRIDGSIWILEGHIKSGYKLIEISLHNNFLDTLNSNDQILLRNLLKLGGLNNTNYKIY